MIKTGYRGQGIGYRVKIGYRGQGIGYRVKIGYRGQGIGYRAKAIAIFVLLLTAYSLQLTAGCSKKALDPSTIKLVDDFNDGEEPNLIGGTSKGIATKGGFAKASYNKEEPFGKTGYSLEISYFVPKDGEAAWSTDLNWLDISQALGISFVVRCKKGSETFALRITDLSGKSCEVNLSKRVKITQNWQRVEIPTKDFSGIDFNGLRSMELVFHDGPLGNSGLIYIDDIAFFGKSQLFFNSLKDNLYGFPQRVILSGREIRNRGDRELLLALAKNTWGYFRDAVDKKHNLPCDFIDIAPTPRIGDYTSPTNMGLYLLCVISAEDLGFVTKEEAVRRVGGILETIEKLPKWHGLLYNFYMTTNLQIAREYISSVDNGWLAAGLIVTRQTYPELNRRCTKLLDDMDFSKFYNKDLGQLNLGYDTKEEKLSPYHYGLLATEPRLTSLIAIGKGDVPKEHWFRIYRTLPPDWDWQAQEPSGEYREYEGVKVFEGYYKINGTKVVPSWGGSLFEFLMPTLLVKEKELAPEALGLNDTRAVKIHQSFARKKGYPVWGLSPCATPDGSYGGYSEFGVAALGTKGYKDEGIVTSHAAMLALDFAPEEVIKNIRKMIELYQIYGEYGLYDSVNINTKEVAQRYLCLDEGMILPALNNYLNKGILRERFHRDPIVKKIEPLLSSEKFF